VRYLTWLNQLPDANRILATQELCVRPIMPLGTAYVVQRGDNVYRIARNFGVDMHILAQHNRLENINLIRTGQTLYVPDFRL
jgi:LysM repeat protein